MIVGFVLIVSNPGKERHIYEALTAIPEIVELHPLFGEYDFLAKIEAEDFDALGKIVITSIRSLPGIQDTETLTGIAF